MIPELRDAYNVSTSTVAWGFTGYLLPFAVLLLVSGTLGTRWGVARSLRLAFALYVPATLFCALAPNFALFMTGRVVQGCINAFMTPLLITALTENVSTNRRGRVVGLYAVFQSLGQILAPLLGGISADINWRLAFVAVALASALVALNLPRSLPASPVLAGTGSAGTGLTSTGPASPGPASPGTAGWLNFRMLWRRPSQLLAITALLAAFGPINVVVLVSLTARDELGLSGAAAGALLLVGTSAAMAAVHPWGRLSDAYGARRAMIAALVIAGVLAAALGRADTVIALTIIWALTGAANQCVVVGFQALAVNVNSDNRGGVVSYTLSHRFFGHSLSNLILVPIYTISPLAAYSISALVAVLAIAAVLASGLGGAGTQPRLR